MATELQPQARSGNTKLRNIPPFPLAPLVYSVPGVEVKIYKDGVPTLYTVPKSYMDLSQIVDHLNTQVSKGPVKHFEAENGDLVYVTLSREENYHADTRPM